VADELRVRCAEPLRENCCGRRAGAYALDGVLMAIGRGARAAAEAGAAAGVRAEAGPEAGAAAGGRSVMIGGPRERDSEAVLLQLYEGPARGARSAAGGVAAGGAASWSEPADSDEPLAELSVRAAMVLGPCLEEVKKLEKRTRGGRSPMMPATQGPAPRPLTSAAGVGRGVIGAQNRFSTAHGSPQRATCSVQRSFPPQHDGGGGGAGEAEDRCCLPHDTSRQGRTASLPANHLPR